MKTKSHILLLFFLLSSFLVKSQITEFKEKFVLPSDTEETSGLLFFDGKIITHNDSGDAANLYEIDSTSGNLLRTVFINNITNVDWEDLTEDENHIYIGDFGNNNGTRTNLKIYKILKSDFKNSTNISAETITFSYQDQTNFNSSNDHNFDAEAFVSYESSLLIFTKNRGDLKTNVYKIPKTAGNHSAIKVSSANVEGLITGATYNGNFLLCGYSPTGIPFLTHISFNRAPGDDIFASGFTRESLISHLGVSQVEGITSYKNGKYYISRERSSGNVNGQQVTLQQTLYEFTDVRDNILSIENFSLENLNISPNPVKSKVTINSNLSLSEIEVYNYLGKTVLKPKFINQNEIDISSLSKGVYFLKIKSKSKKSIVKKIIKL